jgi:serine O-acetyltransferase
MKLNEWLDCEASIVAHRLEDQNRDYYFKNKTLGFASRENILQTLQHLRSALFPGVYDKHPIDEDNTGIVIGNHIREAAIGLGELVEQALVNCCAKDEKGTHICDKCVDHAAEITLELLKKLPDIRDTLHTDIQAAYNGDPAACSYEEIILCYPSIEALSIHRIAHELYKAGVPLLPRAMSEYAHQITGIDIHPGATIGRYFFIDHGTGVVIGETCTIGEHVKLYQGVTLGARSFQLDGNGNPVKGVKRHPDIEDSVIIYAGATILGGNTVIGHNSVIGGNVWLTHSLPPFSTVYNSQPSLVIKNGADDSIFDWVI